MTQSPDIHELIDGLWKNIGARFDGMDQRLDKMKSEIGDMRVQMAEAGVLAVRLDTVEKEISRVERRAAAEIQTAMQYITQIRDELGTYQIDHAKIHGTIQTAQATHLEVLRQLGGRWGTVRSIVVPLIVGVGAAILTMLLSNTF